MWYVNNEGPITSVNACPQSGCAEREVKDDDPELVAFLQRQNAIFGAKTIDEKVESQMNSPVLKALVSALATPEYEQKIRDSLTQHYKSLE